MAPKKEKPFFFWRGGWSGGKEERRKFPSCTEGQTSEEEEESLEVRERERRRKAKFGASEGRRGEQTIFP